jgi:hypothetical protein
MDVKATRFVPALLGAAFLLAGCAGGAQAPSAGIPANSTALMPQNQNRQGGGRCQQGNVRIRPCHIRFDSNNPGPTDVTIGRQGNKTKVKERDDCATKGVATVTQDSNRHYTVTAGSTDGSCTAHFSDGGGQGNGGKLKIVNAL